MKNIEFDGTIYFGEIAVTAIHVKPLKFYELARIWSRMPQNAKAEVYLNRARMSTQVVFMAGEEVVTAKPENISSLPIGVAKRVLDTLDEGSGTQGSVISKGDGIGKPILYKLGSPLEMSDKDGNPEYVNEIEFMAESFGEVEEALACENEVQKAMALLRTIAKPVEIEGWSLLPGALIDQITLADGVGIMKHVCPSF